MQTKVKCCKCGKEVGVVEIEFGTASKYRPTSFKIVCAECGMTAMDDIIAAEYDDTFGYREADCGC
jgi:hypothetical protein